MTATGSEIMDTNYPITSASEIARNLTNHKVNMNYYVDLFVGPMDNTVCDFWRMVWEQHLELILMLTNLEEYSKTKCAKYWPDDAEGDKVFGDFGVVHVREKRYSGLLF
jgi:protein tyrosine phosphatase